MSLEPTPSNASNAEYEEQLDYGDDGEDAQEEGHAAALVEEVLQDDSNMAEADGAGEPGPDPVIKPADEAGSTAMAQDFAEVKDKDAPGSKAEAVKPAVAEASKAATSTAAAAPSSEVKPGRIISLNKPKPKVDTPTAIDQPLKSSSAPTSNWRSGARDANSHLQPTPSTSGLGTSGGGGGGGGHSSKTRYFIIRSSTDANIHISKRENVWATQRHNERILSAAFSAGTVKILFAVNRIGRFYGYGTMTTEPGKLGRTVYWDGGQVFGGAFGVDWECTCELPFSEVSHIRNPLNENKPVSICRDGTEVPVAVGEEIMALMLKFGAKMATSGTKRTLGGGGAMGAPPPRRVAPQLPPPSLPPSAVSSAMPMRGPAPPPPPAGDRRVGGGGAPLMPVRRDLGGGGGVPPHRNGGLGGAVGMAGARTMLLDHPDPVMAMMDPHMANMLMGGMGMPGLPPFGMPMDQSMFMSFQQAAMGGGMRGGGGMGGMSAAGAFNPMGASGMGGFGMNAMHSGKFPSGMGGRSGINSGSNAPMMSSGAAGGGGMSSHPPPPQRPSGVIAPIAGMGGSFGMMNGRPGDSGGLGGGGGATMPAHGGGQRGGAVAVDERRGRRSRSRSRERRRNSRSRTRSRSRSRERPLDISKMTYEEYMKAYQKAQQKLKDGASRVSDRSPRRGGGGGSDRGRSPPRRGGGGGGGGGSYHDERERDSDRDRSALQRHGQYGGRAPELPRASSRGLTAGSGGGGGHYGGGSGGNVAGGGGGFAGGGDVSGSNGSGPVARSGGQPYSEDEYVQVTKSYYTSRGVPAPGEDYIRSHYRQMRQQIVGGSARH